MRTRKRNALSRTLWFALIAVLVLLSKPADAWPGRADRAADAPAQSFLVCKDGPPICSYTVLQEAVDAAGDGDVIKVAAGVYTDVNGYGGLAQVVYITKAVTIRGGYPSAGGYLEPPDPVANPTVVDAQGQGRVMVISGTITATIEGLRLTGGDATGQGGFWPWRDCGGGLYVYMATATISGCAIYGNVASTAREGYGGAVFAYSPNGTTLTGNSVHGNVGSYADTGVGGGLTIMGAAVLNDNLVQGNTASTVGRGLGGGVVLSFGRATLRANTFVRNTAALDPAAVGRGGGLVVLDCGRFTLTNNLLVDNHATTAGGGLYVEGNENPPEGQCLHTTIAHNRGCDQGVFVRWDATVAFSNTIIAGHDTVGITVTQGTTVTLEATLWHDNGMNAAGPVLTGTINLYEDPAFVDPSAWDYHLAAGSPAINAGVDAGVTTDIDGEARPFGSGYDLGADEFTSYVYLPVVFKGCFFSCPSVPDPVDARVKPSCGGVNTKFTMDLWGFDPFEPATIWLHDETGPLPQKPGTIDIGPGGSVSGLWFTPRGMGVAPGLYHWTVEGVISGHQSVVYFAVACAPGQ
jgi:hypothetical protein